MSRSLKRMGSADDVEVVVQCIGKSMSGEKFAQIKIEAFSEEHVAAFSVGQLGSGEPREFFEWIEEKGVPASKQERATLKTDLSVQLKKSLRSHVEGQRPYAVVVDRRGWHGDVFATKYAVHGPKGRPTITAAKLKLLEDEAQSAVPIESVRAFYKEFGHNSSLFKVVAAIGFLPPLLSIMKDCPQPFFLLVGEPHMGKSSLVASAASPWGGASDGVLGFVSSMSGTEFKIEKQASEHRDILFPLDDVQNLVPDPTKRALSLQDICMRICTGRTRANAHTDGVDYRTVVLGASNDTMATMMLAGGITYSEALRDRVIELPCHYEHGIFSWLPAGEDGEGRVRAMKAAAIANRAAPGEHFVKKLIRQNSKTPKSLRRRLEGWRAMARGELDPRASPRTVDAFACAFAAGCLAHEYGILPWEPERLLGAVKRIFQEHVRFTVGELEKLDPIKQLKSFLKKNKQRIAVFNSGAKQTVKKSFLQKAAAIEYRTTDGRVELCLLSRHMRNVFEDNGELAHALKTLKAKRLLKVDQDGKMKKRKFGDWRPHVYSFDAKLLKKAS